MKVFGLTGGVGMGKSEAAEIFRRQGIPVVDTDKLAHQIAQPGQPAFEEIRKEFGLEVIGADGRLRRDKLGDIVFADAAARARLEAILHPRIGELWRAQVQAWRTEDKPLAVVVIPLLFETGAEAEFDSVICVACSAATQRTRLLKRGWSSRQIAQRDDAQLPIEDKMTRSHYVVWNEGDLDVMADQLLRIIPPA